MPVTTITRKNSFFGTCWNVLYDTVFELDMPADVSIIGYADNLVPFMIAGNEQN